MKVVRPSISPSLIKPENVAGLFEDEDSITYALIEDAELGKINLNRKSATDSSFVKTSFVGTAASNFDTSNCEFKSCDFSASEFPESSWHRIMIDSSRCSGTQIVNGKLKNVTIKDSKLEIVNFRFSNLEHVVFQGCVLNDVDFYAAQLKNVEFLNCTITNITFGSGRLFNDDVSTSTIEGIKGVNSLKGVTMSYGQVMRLAPVFAAEVGITIKQG